MYARRAGLASANKHLRPVIAVGHIAYADLGIGPVQDVGAVSAGIHPAIYDCLRSAVALGDVFAGRPADMPKFLIMVAGEP